MNENFSFSQLVGISRNAISMFFQNINIFYLGIISVIFSSIVFIINYIHIKEFNIPTKITQSYVNHFYSKLYSIYTVHTSEIFIILVLLLVYIVASIYFTSFSSTALIKYVISGEGNENFISSWDRGKEKWKEYI